MEPKIKYSRDDAVTLLRKKYDELSSAGEERFPKRGDFTDAEVEAIKAHLGPWPRALEEAGIKPPREDDRLTLNREKRRRAKLRLREASQSEENKQ